MKRINVVTTFFLFAFFLLFGIGNTTHADNLEGKDMVETTGQVGFYGEYVKPVKPGPSKPDGSKPIEIKESSRIGEKKQLPQTNEVIKNTQLSLIGFMIIFISILYVKKIKKNG
ncbi:LPXTG cell wall anchor domain-containing protein [Vagococcus carniphilus]|uniref:Gram-positive cocci surface proteins LPxTG domain-containing protein n=1 Tax=Vagococcus carniphilus TaxID=218144 RepID=A0A430B6Y6_9ENTE|nr:LPXTG cell wall anchor domain-containing protein [Vagococcus carniphilus]QNN72463.1 LPXTG cell wall anchor domain-containing protein [Vagococcus carniphilus]RSU16090.1 hypothetical protein CBF28_03830 [Vagococcus carniphilus]